MFCNIRGNHGNVMVFVGYVSFVVFSNLAGFAISVFDGFWKYADFVNSAVF